MKKFGENNDRRKIQEIERVCILLKLLSTEKCTQERLSIELCVTRKTIYRYLMALSQYFLVCEDLEGPGDSNKHYFYILKGKGKQKNILNLI